MFLRVFADLALVIVVFFVRWWIVVPVAFLFSLRFHRAYELMVVGVVLDTLYGLPIPALGGFRFPFTALCTALFLAVEFLKPRLHVSLW